MTKENNPDLGMILKDYRNSVRRLNEALKKPKTVLTRDASIKRFELTFELAWKALKEYLRDQGIKCYSPKSCLQEAFRMEMIPDNPLWLELIKDRNSSIHTYSEEFANDLYQRLKSYLILFEKLQKGLE